MNPLIKNRLPPDYQMLWQLTRKQRLTGDLGTMIQNQIRQVRKNFRNVKRDPLVQKFLDFGNEGMWSTQKLRELSRAIYENKRPDNVHVGEWISVEIECVMPSESAEIEFLKFVRKNDLGKQITIKNDGSIRTISPRRTGEARSFTDDIPAQARTRSAATITTAAILDNSVQLMQEQTAMRTAFGREIVMTFRYGDWKFVKEVCRKLIQLKCFVNQSCGLHVHFDCRHIDIHDVVRIGKRVASVIPALKQILPPSRRDNRFSATDMNDISGAENRYSFVNLQAYHRHQTIEIRGHSGTIDAAKIVNWIRILKKVMLKRSRKRIDTVSEMINAFQFEDDLIQYVDQRFNKFNKPMEPAENQRHLDEIELDDSVPVPAPDDVMDSQPSAAPASPVVNAGSLEEYIAEAREAISTSPSDELTRIFEATSRLASDSAHTIVWDHANGTVRSARAGARSRRYESNGDND
jgi:hypothetical protein